MLRWGGRWGTFRAVEELHYPFLGNGTNATPTGYENSWHSAWHPRGQKRLVHSEWRVNPINRP